MFEGARGKTGEVRVGGRTAARFIDWSLYNKGNDQWEIRATLGERHDLYLSSRGPFEVRLDLGKRQWRWCNVTTEEQPWGLLIGTEGPWEQL